MLFQRKTTVCHEYFGQDCSCTVSDGGAGDIGVMSIVIGVDNVADNNGT